jgi:hypothetical protein
MFEPENLNTSLFSNLLESARLELQGAERRLSLANLAHKNFIDEHGILTDDGQLIYTPTPTREMLLSLEHERDALETEIDEALRRITHCRDEIEILQLAAAVEDDSISDLILGLPQTDEGENDAG